MNELPKPNLVPRLYGEALWGEEPIALRVFHPKPGDVFFDIGASDSFWTVYAATRGALVYAFEPSIPQFQRLVEELLKEGVFSQCRAIMMGADSKDNVRTLEGWYEGLGGPGFDVSEDCRVATRFIPIDFFEPELKRLDWMKLDIEGGELEALRGGAKVIEKFRPTVIIENHINIVRIGPWMRANRVIEGIHAFFARLGNYEISEDPGIAERPFIVARPKERGLTKPAL